MSPLAISFQPYAHRYWRYSFDTSLLFEDTKEGKGKRKWCKGLSCKVILLSWDGSEEWLPHALS